MASFGVAGCLALLAPLSRGQGVSWSGVNEGSVIQLALGATSTNLAISVIPTIPSSPTNIVFVLERQGAVLLSRTSAPPYAVTFANLSPGKYFVTAKLETPSQAVLGDLSFDIAQATVRPANDDWSHAALLSALGETVSGSNLNASRESNEPTVPSGGGAGKTIWWAWTASASGAFTATTAGSSFDTVLGVFTGTNLATLVSIAENDDIGPNAFSQVTFMATKDATYYFAVDSATGRAGGQAELRLLAGAPPVLAMTAPPDGYLMLVASSAVATNVTATMTATDASGIASVNYWFDGGTNISRSGALAAPYQLSLTNLFAGHYLLTVAASNNAGLVSVVNAGLSVISLEPVLVMERMGLMAGKFQMAMTGFKGPKYTLQSSTNLDVWCGTGTWTNFPGAVKVADTNVAQIQRRFFRAVSEP
jgi:hypothetical protein